MKRLHSNIKSQRASARSGYGKSRQKKRRSSLRTFFVWTTRILSLVISLPFILLFTANQLIRISSNDKLYDALPEVPVNQTALVLGTSHRVRSGGPNPYFHNRMQAAAELYHSGKVKYLIVSGDNRTRWYNEPEEMMQQLIRLGVPKNDIYMDFAGLRTLDSVIRARDVFGQDSITVVSQRFHNQRAVYIASVNGLHAVAYNAADVHSSQHFRILVREWFAKAMVFWDLFLGTRPDTGGETIQIGKQLQANSYKLTATS